MSDERTEAERLDRSLRNIVLLVRFLKKREPDIPWQSAADMLEGIACEHLDEIARLQQERDAAIREAAARNLWLQDARQEALARTREAEALREEVERLRALIDDYIPTDCHPLTDAPARVQPMVPDACEKVEELRHACWGRFISECEFEMLTDGIYGDGHAAGFAAALAMLQKPCDRTLSAAARAIMVRDHEPDDILQLPEYQRLEYGESALAALRAAASALADSAETEGGNAA